MIGDLRDSVFQPAATEALYVGQKPPSGLRISPGATTVYIPAVPEGWDIEIGDQRKLHAAAAQFVEAIDRLKDNVRTEQILTILQTHDQNGSFQQQFDRVNHPAYDSTYKHAQDVTMKGLGLDGILGNPDGLFAPDTESRFQYIDSMRKLLATDWPNSPHTPQIRAVQDAARAYTHALVPYAKDPYQERYVLACKDDAQFALANVGWGQDGHVIPEGYNDPSWRPLKSKASDNPRITTFITSAGEVAVIEPEVA